MGIFLGVLFGLVALVMVFAVLLQEGKGGGLAGMSGAATDSVIGAKNPLRKITAYCFAFFLLVVIALNYTHNRQATAQITGGLVVTPISVDDALGDSSAPDQILDTSSFALPASSAIPPEVANPATDAANTSDAVASDIKEQIDSQLPTSTESSDNK